MQISRATFDEQRRPRFGTANPERMQLAFWEWMVRGDDMPPADPGSALGELGLMMRAGVLTRAIDCRPSGAEETGHLTLV
jgi:hypothetical protein